jgi:hypothetical protein
MDEQANAATAAAEPAPAPKAGFDLLPYAPYALLIASLTALKFGVDQGTVAPVMTVALLLIDPRQVMGRR